MARVLWLSNETPDRFGQGGQRRQFFQLREVSMAGHEVTLCTLDGSQSDAEIRRYADVIRTSTHWRGRVPRVRHRQLLRRLAQQQWDALVIAHTESWPTFQGMALASQAPIWVDLHNVLGKGVDGTSTRWEDVERDISARASIVSVCSDQELDRLLGQQPLMGARPVVMGHGVDPEEWTTSRAPAAQPLVKLFGNWAWDPNRRGLEWFLSEVWPKVGVAGATCEVAGSGAEIDNALAGVTFVGRVPRLDAWTGDAWVLAVPVIGGVGAPVKYLEGLATGAPVLATPDGAPVARELASLVSGDPQEWVTTMRNLLGGSAAPPSAPELPDRYTWKGAVEPLTDWLRSSGAGSA